MKFGNIVIVDTAGISYNPVLSMNSLGKPAIHFESVCGTKGCTPKWGIDLFQFKGESLAIDFGTGWKFPLIQPTLKAVKDALGFPPEPVMVEPVEDTPKVKFWVIMAPVGEYLFNNGMRDVKSDVVSFDADHTEEDVRRSLIDHDGYNPNMIIVAK